MPHEDDDLALLFDMLEAAQAVVRFTSNRTQAQYGLDELLRAAVERKIEIIGEACRGISPATRVAHPEIPWRKIAATRHVLAHDYDEVNDEIVWRIATSYVPDLIVQLRPLVPHPEDTSEGN
jgi:uncharacterized protein with HEPN domain